ncbi:MAG: glycoside hydrolase family 2, partial [Clostridiales bacterium]|nr:glycoside hydrolase family 2 [Clostridiales bacterium]
AGERESSSLFTLLNGVWNFRAHKRVEDVRVPESLYDTVAVPGCVQLQGYDMPQYTNIRFPFPFDPPYIRKDNPAFHYRRTFTVTQTRGVRLVFEGVDSCFYVYVNGKKVGFSQVSHRVSEFDISPFVREGQNTLDVIVIKWCAGSYLEDQDKWRFTGIFRDVYLLTRAEGCVEDYKIETDVTGGKGIVRFTLLRGGDAEVCLEGQTRTVRSGETAEFTVENPRLWSAETPALYDLQIHAAGETIYEKVGIRSVKIESGVLKVNGKAIKLHGVNRHDFHPERGAAVNKEDMRRDLQLMKDYNVNALRTSHYPSAPELYRMADEMGLYVMSESDVECHGVVAIDGDSDGEKYDMFAQGDMFTDAILERNILNYETQKNRTSVIMWSLGNEAGYGKNFTAAAEWLHAHDSRPVHYEQHVHAAGKESYYTDPIDVVSRMYPSIEDMQAILNDKKETRPLILCEYTHAMGNSCGDLGDYMNMFYGTDRCAGGFIWEWADHGLSYGGKKDLYGSDFRNMNDGNFCIDGLFAPDRTPKPACFEMRAQYAYARFVKENDDYYLVNRYAFLEIAGEVRIAVKREGGEIFSTSISVRVAA